MGFGESEVFDDADGDSDSEGDGVLLGEVLIFGEVESLELVEGEVDTFVDPVLIGELESETDAFVDGVAIPLRDMVPDTLVVLEFDVDDEVEVVPVTERLDDVDDEMVGEWELEPVPQLLPDGVVDHDSEFDVVRVNSDVGDSLLDFEPIRDTVELADTEGEYEAFTDFDISALVVRRTLTDDKVVGDSVEEVEIVGVVSEDLDVEDEGEGSADVERTALLVDDLLGTFVGEIPADFDVVEVAETVGLTSWLKVVLELVDGDGETELEWDVVGVMDALVDDDADNDILPEVEPLSEGFFVIVDETHDVAERLGDGEVLEDVLAVRVNEERVVTVPDEETVLEGESRRCVPETVAETLIVLVMVFDVLGEVVLEGVLEFVVVALCVLVIIPVAVFFTVVETEGD